MPTYVYRNRATGETVEKQMAVAERDNTPPDWERVTVPSSIAAPQFRSDPHTAAASVPKAFREYELSGKDCRTIERETGFSRDHIRRVWSFLALLLFAVALPAMAGDITPGYSFTPNDRVTNVKLNSAASGTINTAFFTGKTSEMPVASDICLYYNAVAGVFRKITFGDGFLNNTNLIVGKSEDTSPADSDYLLTYDRSGNTLAKITISNLTTTILGTTVYTNSGTVRDAAVTGGWLNSSGITVTYSANAVRLLYSYVECTNTDGAFAIGDKIPSTCLWDTNGLPAICLVWSPTNYLIRLVPGAIRTRSDLGGGTQDLDRTKWNIGIRAFY